MTWSRKSEGDDELSNPQGDFQEAPDMVELINSFTLYHLCLHQVQTHSESGQRCCDVPVLQTSSNSGGHQRLCWLQGQFLQRVFQVISSVGDATGAARTYPAYTQLQTQSKTRIRSTKDVITLTVAFRMFQSITAALSHFLKKRYWSELQTLKEPDREMFIPRLVWQDQTRSARKSSQMSLQVISQEPLMNIPNEWTNWQSRGEHKAGLQAWDGVRKRKTACVRKR